MIPRLYELLTGRPWTTTHSMSAEYGPPPGAVYAHQLAKFTDAELIADGDHILAALRNQDTITAWLQHGRREQTATYWTLLPACGCPVGVVVDEGHQEGCHLHQVDADVLATVSRVSL